METWKRHICYCMIVIIVMTIWIFLTDHKAIEHLICVALLTLFGLFMALVAVPLARKRKIIK